MFRIVSLRYGKGLASEHICINTYIYIYAYVYTYIDLSPYPPAGFGSSSKVPRVTSRLWSLHSNVSTPTLQLFPSYHPHACPTFRPPPPLKYGWRDGNMIQSGSRCFKKKRTNMDFWGNELLYFERKPVFWGSRCHKSLQPFTYYSSHEFGYNLVKDYDNSASCQLTTAPFTIPGWMMLQDRMDMEHGWFGWMESRGCVPFIRSHECFVYLPASCGQFKAPRSTVPAHSEQEDNPGWRAARHVPSHDTPLHILFSSPKSKHK